MPSARRTSTSRAVSSGKLALGAVRSNQIATRAAGARQIARATLAYDPTSGQSSCQAVTELGLRGESEPGETGGGVQTESTTPVQIEAKLGGLPLMGRPSPTTRRLTARIRSNGGCTEASRIDSARWRVLDFG